MSPEGGCFDIMAGRYANGATNFDVWLKGHAGDAIRVDRKGRPAEFVAHPALTMGLAVQPVVLRQIVGHQGFRLPRRLAVSRPLGAAGRDEIEVAVADERAQLEEPVVDHDTEVVGAQQADQAAFHTDFGVVDESGRGVLLDYYPSGDPSRSFVSVADLIAAIRRFVDGWNDHCEPFVWTKTAERSCLMRRW